MPIPKVTMIHVLPVEENMEAINVALDAACKELRADGEHITAMTLANGFARKHVTWRSMRDDIAEIMSEGSRPASDLALARLLVAVCEAAL